MGSIANEIHNSDFHGQLQIPAGEQWEIEVGENAGERVNWSVVSEAIDRELQALQNGEESFLTPDLRSAVDGIRADGVVTESEMGSFYNLALTQNVGDALEHAVAAVAAEVNKE
ncbi:MAG: hypothetical protein AAFV32_02405 [Myxococcota bacterium]